MSFSMMEMMNIFGDRWYGELQWSKTPEQHILNKNIIQLHREFGIGLISTADSHYPNPDAWKDRELYKRLGWLGKTSKPVYCSDVLPASVDEIGYELYPKNGQQMWDAYKYYSDCCGAEYDDDLIRQSIEETYSIAHNRIESFIPDNFRNQAYENIALPIGEDQTISQPYIVALMTESLKLNKKHKVLIEGIDGKIAHGYTENYIKVKIDDSSLNVNQLVSIKPTTNNPDYMMGDLV